jgi:hypothetical protein
MENDNLGGSLSPEENAFFESGGASAIPSEDAGSVSPGNGSDGSPGDKGADQGKTADKAPSTVPLAALHEERTRRKDLDTKYREAEKQIAELKGKFSIIERLNMPGGEKEAPKGPPTVEEDIFGAVKHVTETLGQMQKREADEKAAREAETTAATERQTFVTNYQADAEKFKSTAPDYMEAYNFLLNSRAAELRAIGYDTPQSLHEAITADEYAIADMAFKKGKSPAEMIYALANQRGYKKADAGAADTGKGAEKLATIERGQAANKSLSNTGGSSGDPEMTAAALIAMDLPEFEAWTAKNPAKAKRLMGG